ncbi:MAG TPA: HEXXH motif-containing putative peptide modification protein [Allosphingosinicella sp.]|jgi:HEXXH motif-containing protein|nr:HEXXH motif-containing putative peptide modification protein [Allosphingosinicella sp.]
MDQPEADWIGDRLCVPGGALRAGLEQRDFTFLSETEAASRQDTLRAAAELINLVPSLAAIVRGRVRKIYLLDAPPGYDISHSEPRWPESVFVSVPAGGGAVSALRSAESIVHESMHLHLTIYERREALVADPDAELFSPWKQELRDVQGNLHALYVFVCIRAFLTGLDLALFDSPGQRYLVRRADEITAELAALELEALNARLTPAGQALVDNILWKREFRPASSGPATNGL